MILLIALSVLSLIEGWFFRSLKPTALDRDFRHPAHIAFCVAPSYNESAEDRIVCLLSIDYAFRPRLRSRLTLGG